ncbi:hypothetical protein L1987_55553 [Smallanthus sonchifolius]|uniref:Uncharacterized protein n=1 Tax=Smallanthus sonchifolius TaxID=185202 RepID=A0ACB9EA90_9ASTR|nr:hypothetical protein L1987_55553 [Smallanthus sonchifolius]
MDRSEHDISRSLAVYRLLNSAYIDMELSSSTSRRSRSLKMGEETVETARDIPIFRDIRRYTCAYCGIVRSKKTIINAHIQAHHQDEIKEKEGNEEEEQKGGEMNVCEECGASFRKPAHLKQHMQSHSLEGINMY